MYEKDMEDNTHNVKWLNYPNSGQNICLSVLTKTPTNYKNLNRVKRTKPN